MIDKQFVFQFFLHWSQQIYNEQENLIHKWIFNEWKFSCNSTDDSKMKMIFFVLHPNQTKPKNGNHLKMWLINVVVVVVGTMFQTRLFTTAADTVVVGFLKFWTHANNKIIYKIVKWKERKWWTNFRFDARNQHTHTHWKIYRKIHCCSIQNLAHVMLAAWMQKKQSIISVVAVFLLVASSRMLTQRFGWWNEMDEKLDMKIQKNKELNFTFSKFIISKKLSLFIIVVDIHSNYLNRNLKRVHEFWLLTLGHTHMHIKLPAGQFTGGCRSMCNLNVNDRISLKNSWIFFHFFLHSQSFIHSNFFLLICFLHNL